MRDLASGSRTRAGGWLTLLNPLLALRDAGRLVYRGLERGVASGWPGLVRVTVGLTLGWWVYVPMHELLHAAACLSSGGAVTELEISPLYGGSLLARVFPFVVAGGSYAGRLSGFDTGGSDLVYLATDLGPFALTLFPGVWALRRAALCGHGGRYGFWLPFALAPFLSLTGDAYEIGSIVVTQLPPWEDQAAVEALRGDDLLLEVRAALQGGRESPWGGLALAALVGAYWSCLTFAAGASIGRRVRPRSETS